jgi:hypothetical protein
VTKGIIAGIALGALLCAAHWHGYRRGSALLETYISAASMYQECNAMAWKQFAELAACERSRGDQ